jgi:uncharacterized protein
MYDTLILHGSYGSPYGNWFPWLARALEERGRKVLVPQFPVGDLQNLANWSKVLDGYREFLIPDFDVYAHSLAPAFIANYAPSRDLRIRKAILVVPFYSMIGIPEFDSVNRSFMDIPGGPAELAKCCREITCLFSDNDPYVPQGDCESFTSAVGGKPVVVPNGGHLNAEAGFTEFQLLLDL